jgi:hypothetical protein
MDAPLGFRGSYSGGGIILGLLAALWTITVKPVFDHHGSVVAWLLGESILDMDGTLVAFIYDSLVYSKGGEPVGFFAEGYFWQRNGHAVGFVECATSGPALPLVAIPPFPPTSKAGVIPPVPRRRASLPSRGAAWSDIPWSAYVHGAAGWWGIDLASDPPLAS